MISNKESFDKSNIMKIMKACVVKRDDPYKEGRIGVYIPDLMYYFSPYEDEKVVSEVPVKPSLLKNEDKKKLEDGSYSTKNYYWVRPVEFIQNNPRYYSNEKVQGGSYKVPYIDQWVFVFFLDSDINKGYYLPFTSNIDAEKITGSDIYELDHWMDPVKKPYNDVVENWDGFIIERNTFTDRVGNYYRIKSPDGYEILLEFNPTRKKLEITSSNGHNIILDDFRNKEKIQIKTNHGHTVLLDDKNEKIELNTRFNHSIKLDDLTQSIDIISKDGNCIELNDKSNSINISSIGSINIKSSNEINLKSKSINIDGDLNLKGNLKK